MRLDAIDRKLLYELDQDSRKPLSQVAKKLRIGRNVLLYRLNRLKEEGIVRGTFTQINNFALGYYSFRIFIKLGNCSGEQEKNFVNEIKKEKNLLWLSRVLGKWDLDIIYMSIFFYYKIYPHVIVNSLNILVFLLTVLIMFKGLNKPELFASLTENKSVKYSGSKLKESDRIIIKNKLDHILTNEKFYNNPNICINDLADKIGFLPKHVSQVINEDYKQNFFDLINSFRIEEAKALLTKHSSDSKNILEILYYTGFNSKTSFNLAFKKYTGHTPTSYRRLFSKN